MMWMVQVLSQQG
jgi:hypothetical protein